MAEERGIPLARVGLGVAGSRTCRTSGRPGGRRRAPRRRAPADPDGERLRSAPYFTDMPEALEDPGVALHAPTLRFRTADVPEPAAHTGAPLVYVSFGSVTAGAHLPLYPALYRAAIDALAPLPVQILLTVGEDRDHGELGPLPENVQVERWVPQEEVLPRAAAVVTHGGHGSTLGALAHGVPVVVLPLFSLDQWFNGEAVVRAGAGVALDGERHSRRGVSLPARRRSPRSRRRSSTSSSDPAPRRAAEEIAEAMRALPSVDDAPAELERIAATS